MKRFAMLTALAAIVPGIALGESDSDLSGRTEDVLPRGTALG